MLTIFDTLVTNNYDQKRDLLYLHVNNADFSAAIGSEPRVGIVIFKDMRTKQFVGLTVIDCCSMKEKRENSLRELGINIDLGSYCNKA
jgi:hypothetical protein